MNCVIQIEWEPLAEFLSSFPHTALAERAVDRGLVAFHAIGPAVDLRLKTDEDDPVETRRLVESLERVGRLVAPPQGTRLLIRAGQLWDQLAEHEWARSAYAAASKGAPEALRACIPASATRHGVLRRSTEAPGHRDSVRNR